MKKKIIAMTTLVLLVGVACVVVSYRLGFDHGQKEQYNLTLLENGQLGMLHLSTWKDILSESETEDEKIDRAIEFYKHATPKEFHMPDIDAVVYALRVVINEPKSNPSEVLREYANDFRVVSWDEYKTSNRALQKDIKKMGLDFQNANNPRH